LITNPKTTESQIVHIELLPLRDLMVLLIVVLNDAVIKRKILSFGQDMTPEQLGQISGKLMYYMQD